MTRLGSTFVSEDPDSRGTQGDKGDTGPVSTVPGPTGPSGTIESVVAGTNVTVDATDPNNPIINASGGGGGGLNLHSDVLSESVTKAFSASAFASKGSTYNCINAVTMRAISVPMGSDNSATYKLVIAEVSGATDVIDAITGTSQTTAATTAAEPSKDFIFAGGVPLVAGKRYAFVVVRTDGTATAITRISSPTSPVGTSYTNLEFVALVRFASNEPQISDVTRLQTSSATHMTLIYSVD